jgi:hypothetical protein
MSSRWMSPTLALLAAGTLAACHHGATAAAVTPEAGVSPDESKDGFVSLFDGHSTSGWRGFRMDTVPTGWQVIDGNLVRVASGADLISRKQYTNFELRLEWNISEGGNSGIMYRVTEAAEQSYETGPEMQVLDDARHPDGKNRLTSAGACYGMYPSPAGIVLPPGQWNKVRIIVKGNHVEHWLNGTRVVEYELKSPDWVTRLNASKFKQWPGYGLAPTGYLALQDHGDRVMYRNIRIKVLP